MLKKPRHFNEKSLLLEKKKPSFKEKSISIIINLLVLLFFAIIIVLGWFFLFASPKEELLEYRLESALNDYIDLNKKMEDLEVILAGFEQKDNDIHRVALNLDSLPMKFRLKPLSSYSSQSSEDSIIENIHNKIDELLIRTYRQSLSYDTLLLLSKKKEKDILRLPSITPVDLKQSKIGSGFGMRLHPIIKVKKMHYGIDFPAFVGTPVYATAAGVVRNSSQLGSYGKTIIIDHQNGFETLYAHLSEYKVRKNQKVHRGQLIGHIGATGLVSGPNLHYEVIFKKKKINPINYFYQNLTPVEYNEIIKKAEVVNQSYD